MIILSGLIILSGAIKTQVIISYPFETKTEKRLILFYSPHDPITITNDDDFTDYLFPGSGTAGDPYIIEDYNITTTSNFGIHIYNTTKYFVIRNCYVDTHQHCIFISNVAEGTASIINNICSDSFAVGSGIHLSYSTGATLINNTCTENYFGISLYYSSGVTLTNNSCSNNALGIFLSSSPGATLTNNICINNWHGIYLDTSSGATLTNNTFFNSGLSIEEENMEDYLSYTLENNWVNDKLLGFFSNLNKVTFSEPIYGQLILINCNKMVISNQELSNTTIGLFLKWCETATISNNICNNNSGNGIYLGNCSDATLTDNTCSYKGSKGIYLVTSLGATLTDNTCTKSRDGICLSSSSGATLTNNICNDNYNDGISLSSSDCTLTDNTCNDNGYCGIRMSSSSNNILTQNTCKNNRWGIRLGGSDCLLTYNLLQENEEHGIVILSSSYRNTIHRNSFIDNNPGGSSQAYDEGENNTWYDVKRKKGNFWSDWDQSGSYFIDGRADSIDPYPLDKIPKRIDYNFVMLIPSIILLTILHKKYKKKKSRIYS